MRYAKIFAFSCPGIDHEFVKEWFQASIPSAIESGFTQYELEVTEQGERTIYKILTEADNIESMVELSFQLGIAVFALLSAAGVPSEAGFQINTDLFR